MNLAEELKTDVDRLLRDLSTWRGIALDWLEAHALLDLDAYPECAKATIEALRGERQEPALLEFGRIQAAGETLTFPAASNGVDQTGLAIVARQPEEAEGGGQGVTTFADLGGILKGARLAERKSLRSVANEVGMHFTLLSKMENNRLTREQWPSGDVLIALCEVLVVDKAMVLAAAGKIPTIIKDALKDVRFMRICLDSAHRPESDASANARPSSD